MVETESCWTTSNRVEVCQDYFQVGAQMCWNQQTKTTAKATKGLGIIKKTKEEEPVEGAAFFVISENHHCGGSSLYKIKLRDIGQDAMVSDFE